MPRTVPDQRPTLPTSVRERRLDRPFGWRAGFTLVELLVVIAITGTLVGLLLPAVAAQRETARRTQCVSRLKQVGVGLHAYHAAYSSLPSGLVADVERGFDSKSWGWGALLLPFIEERQLSDQLEPNRRSFSEATWEVERAESLLANISAYRCPSDEEVYQAHYLRLMFLPFTVGQQLASGRGSAGPLSSSPGPAAPRHASPPLTPPSPDAPWEEDYTVGVRMAKSNYAASIGSGWKAQWEEWNATDFEGDGLFGRNSATRYSEITDGASKTIAIGERSYRNYAAVWAGSNSWQRCGFIDNQMVLGTAFYPINDPPIPINMGCNGQGSANFSSYHPGGANFLFGDGSVRFLSQQIDTPAFHQMASRDDGENPSGF
ncbi:MAG: DUF1559 domain-containing protein [Planctomycetota bacterium]